MNAYLGVIHTYLIVTSSTVRQDNLWKNKFLLYNNHFQSIIKINQGAIFTGVFTLASCKKVLKPKTWRIMYTGTYGGGHRYWNIHILYAI